MRRFLAAFNDQDTQTVAACLADEVRVRIPGRHQLAGQFTDRAALLEHLRRMWQQPGNVWRFVGYDDWLASERRVFTIGSLHAQLPGRIRDWRRYLLFDLPAAEFAPPENLVIERLDIFEDDDQTLIDDFVDRTCLP